MEEFRVWLPLVIAIVGLVGGAILYNVQKAVDRRNQIHQERREIYRRFVICYNDLNHHIILDAETDTQMDRLGTLRKVCAEIAVTAPDDVVSNCEDIPRLFGKVGVCRYPVDGSDVDEEAVNKAESALHLKYLDAIAAMRRDSFSDTVISRKTLENVISGFLVSIGKGI